MPLRDSVRKQPVLWFVIFTYGFSWTLWLLMILSARNLLPFRFPTSPAGSFGPAFGGLLTALLLDGGKGLKAVLKSLVQVKASLSAYLFAIFLVVGIYAVGILVSSALRGSWPAVRLELPAGKLIGYFFLILVLGGPLGEEVGWRGVLQPILHRTLTPFAGSALIALIWFVWHVPLFWLEGAAQKGESILSFLVSTSAFAFLFTWLYLKARGSLFLAILFHTAINFVSAVLVPALVSGWQKEGGSGGLLLVIFAAAASLFVILARREFFRKASLSAERAA